MKLQEYFKRGQDERYKKQYCCVGIEMDYQFRKYKKILPLDLCMPLLIDKLTFEDYYYDAYNQYDECLRRVYGDYWSFPKQIKQKHNGEMSHYSMKDSQIVTNISNKSNIQV